MDEIVAAKDRTALLRQGVALIDAESRDGRLIVEVTGAPEDRARAVVAERLGSTTRVTVVDDLPRRLTRGRRSGTWSARLAGSSSGTSCGRTSTWPTSS